MDKKYFVLKSLKGPSLLNEKPSEQVIISRSGPKNEGGVLGKFVGGVSTHQDHSGPLDATNKQNSHLMSFDLPHRRNISLDKHMPVPLFPKTT